MKIIKNIFYGLVVTLLLFAWVLAVYSFFKNDDMFYFYVMYLCLMSIYFIVKKRTNLFPMFVTIFMWLALFVWNLCDLDVSLYLENILVYLFDVIPMTALIMRVKEAVHEAETI